MDNYPTSNGPGTLDLAHPCINESNQVGLFVGADVVMEYPIGGTTSSNPPAGNVWPVGNKSQTEIETSSYTLAGWEHLPSFTAVVNESPTPWIFNHFRNEFFNYLDPISIPGISQILIANPTRYAQNLSSQQIPTGLNEPVDLVCDNLFNSIVFPLRPGNNSITGVPDVTWLQNMNENYLSQNVPNPAFQSTIISYLLTRSTESGSLEVFELGTGRVLKKFIISHSGKGEIEFETKNLPSGIFGYRLLADGKPVCHKKLVNFH